METGKAVHVLDSTGRDVHAEGARLREEGGIARVEFPGGVLGWSISGYSQIKEALAHPLISKDPRQHWPAFMRNEIGMDWPLISWVMMDNMTTAFGAERARLRKVISKGFTPRRVEALRPRVESIVTGLLDDIEASAGTVVDLKSRFAYQLPARMICELAGVPEEARAEMLVGGEVTTDTRITPEQAAENVRHWQAMMQSLVDLKRGEPGDDLTTDLIAGRDDEGNALTDSELVGTLFLVLGAGSETVMNLIGNAVVALLTNPGQLELVRSGRITWDDVIEETLRVDAPIVQLPLRFAVEDIEINGVAIPKGEPIIIGFGAAGRDPERHGATAEIFDVTRLSKEHLSFGYGVHYCLGAPLARVEAGVALSKLFARFPEMRLASTDLEPQGTFIMNGYREIPVLLDPARQPSRPAEKISQSA